jgi:SAM-dependent methyltransferase
MGSSDECRIPRPPEERYRSEIAYFDGEAERAARELVPIDPCALRRYALHRRRRYSKEFRLRVVRPLEGKRLLEVGCGDGETGVLLAKLGARVTGIDISPRSVELATRRARAAGMSDRASFVCGPLATVDVPENHFDIVWGDGILHHIIDELDRVLARVVRWARPGATAIFCEPMNLCPPLRKLRLMLPVPMEGTPDERPLERAELDLLARHIPTLQMRPFGMLGRLTRFILHEENHERSPILRRSMAAVLHAMDYGLLSAPFMAPLASRAVLYGVVEK